MKPCSCSQSDMIWQDFGILLLGIAIVLMWGYMYFDTIASTLQQFTNISAIFLLVHSNQLLFWRGDACDWTLSVCSQVASNTAVAEHISTLENKHYQLVPCHLRQKMIRNHWHYVYYPHSAGTKRLFEEPPSLLPSFYPHYSLPCCFPSSLSIYIYYLPHPSLLLFPPCPCTPSPSSLSFIGTMYTAETNQLFEEPHKNK